MISENLKKKLLANTSRTSCLMQFVQYVSRNIFFSADLSQQLFPLRIQKTFWILAILNTTRDRHYASIIIIITMFDILIDCVIFKIQKTRSWHGLIIFNFGKYMIFLCNSSFIHFFMTASITIKNLDKVIFRTIPTPMHFEPTFTCSKPMRETPEENAKSVQIKLTLLWRLYC